MLEKTRSRRWIILEYPRNPNSRSGKWAKKYRDDNLGKEMVYKMPNCFIIFKSKSPIFQGEFNAMTDCDS